MLQPVVFALPSGTEWRICCGILKWKLQDCTIVNIIDVAYFSGLFNVTLRGLSVLERRDSKVATCDWHAGWRAFEPVW